MPLKTASITLPNLWHSLCDRVFRPSPGLLLSASSAWVVCWGASSPAASLDLQVAPLLSRTPSGVCPQSLTLFETFQPYREGSYGVNGRAPLAAIASGWHVSSRDLFSVIWSADLRPAYRGCTASAGIVRLDDRAHREHSYLRMRFLSGRVQLILDMTGLRDPNGYTPSILSAGLNQGLPVWSWGGSD